MDYLRSCYSTDMQFDLAGEIVGKVKWYWAAKGAKIFPYQNSFSSDNWITPSNSTLGLGEVWTSPRPWRNGSLLVVPPGDGHVCGDISWFTDGCPSDAAPLQRSPSGLALCCSTGGLLLGGDYKLRFGGGLLLSGDYSIPAPLCQPFYTAHSGSATLRRESTGGLWTFTGFFGGSYFFHDPILGSFYEIVLASLGTACIPGFAAAGSVVQVPPSSTARMTFVSYDLTTNIGKWKVPLTFPMYAGEIFDFFCPP